MMLRFILKFLGFNILINQVNNFVRWKKFGFNFKKGHLFSFS